MSFIEWLHATGYATVIRESLIIYPYLQVIHIVALSFLAGSLTVVSLRVAGLGSRIPARDLIPTVMPLAWASLVVVVLTGTHMAVGFFEVFAVNDPMKIKLALLAVVLIYTARFHYRFNRELLLGSGDPVFTGRDKALAIGAIVIWTLIITMGKLLAYIQGKD
jgi:hypothetical protein